MESLGAGVGGDGGGGGGGGGALGRVFSLNADHRHRFCMNLVFVWLLVVETLATTITTT